MGFNIKKFFDDNVLSLAKMVVSNIKSNINNRTFNHAPFGAPLKKETIKRKKGSVALYGVGKFKNGLTQTKTNAGASIFSSGRTNRQQEGFVLGKAKGVPERNPFVDTLPVGRSSQTIGEKTALVFGMKLENYIDKEISKLKGVT